MVFHVNVIELLVEIQSTAFCENQRNLRHTCVRFYFYFYFFTMYNKTATPLTLHPSISGHILSAFNVQICSSCDLINSLVFFVFLFFSSSTFALFRKRDRQLVCDTFTPASTRIDYFYYIYEQRLPTFLTVSVTFLKGVKFAIDLAKSFLKVLNLENVSVN